MAYLAPYMNVLIIENSKRSLQIMRRFLAKNLPDVSVNEYQRIDDLEAFATDLETCLREAE